MPEGTRVVICQRTVGEASLPGYGPVILSNRPVRTRMPGGVGAGGEKPPATRLSVALFIIRTHAANTDDNSSFRCRWLIILNDALKDSFAYGFAFNLAFVFLINETHISRPIVFWNACAIHYKFRFSYVALPI